MKRRALLAAAAWAPIGVIWAPSAMSQSAGGAETLKRIAVLMDQPDGEIGRRRLKALTEGLAALGWQEGRSLRIDVRWGPNDGETAQRLATELVGLGPQAIVVSSSRSAAGAMRATRETPIIFTLVTDPVSSGLVSSVARPSGNLTGFMLFDNALSGKWLSILREVSPGITRILAIWDPELASGAGQLAMLQSTAEPIGIAIQGVDIRDLGAVKTEIVKFATSPNGGMIVTASPAAGIHRDMLTSLAAEHRLPAIYPYGHFVTAGGLISYGPDLIEPFAKAADYVDKILKGAKPSGLPVQAPTRYEMLINLKTAKALGVEIGPLLLARADEVID